MNFGKRVDGVDGRRSVARKALLVPAAVSTLNWSKSAVLLDISELGAKLHTDRTLRVGERLLVKAGPTPILGVVAWADASCYGIRFVDPVPAEEVDRLHQSGKWAALTGLSADELLAIEHWASGSAR